MAKMVNEVLSKSKENIDEVKTGKGAFSKSGFSDLVGALANDTSFKVKTYDAKTGKVTGEVSISELIRNDLKKTLEKAKWPQKSEAGVLDSCEIVTTGLAEAIPHIIMEQLKCGKKFDMPAQKNVVGSIYLSETKPGTKVTQIRDPKTQEALGTVETTSQAAVQIRAKSPVPEHLQKKVRKDVNGKEIK